MGSNNSTPVTRQRVQRKYPTTNEIYAKFYKLCSEGNVTAVSRCIDEYNINIYDGGNAAFVIACVNDHLELAKWFYYIVSKDSMRIHDNNDAILMHLIDAAPTRVVKWFLHIDKKFNITQNNNAMFHKLCANNRVGIAKMFEELCDDYRIEVELDDEIKLDDDCDESDAPDDNLKIINYHILTGEITELSILKSLHIIPVSHRELKNTECTSCFEECTLVLPCHHVMCVSCFYTWYYARRNYSLCTVCKVKFNYDDCVYIKKQETYHNILEIEEDKPKQTESDILNLNDIEVSEDLLIFEDCHSEEYTM